jgi:hypothetical protein
MAVTATIACTNAGLEEPGSDDRLAIEALSTTSPEFTATIRGEPPPGGYAVGERFAVDVTYLPADEGPDAATLELRSNASAEPVRIPLSGTGLVLPPCDFEIVPERLQFGLVDKGSSATLEFAVRNHRADAACLVRNLRLAPTCASAFSLPAGEVQAAVLPPSGELRYPVHFAPRAYQADAFTCEVRFDVSNPTCSHQVVPVRGASQEPCVLLGPNELDFGPVRPGCATRDREAQIINACS